MITISYMLAVVLGLACVLGGWILYKVLRGGNSQEWESKFHALESDVKSLQKKNNKLNQQNDGLKSKADSWKQEYHVLTQEVQKIKKENQSRLTSLGDQINTIRLDTQTEKNAKDKATTSLEKLKKEHERLREKYNRDVAAGADWRTERTKLERELKSTTDRLTKASASAEEYRGKYAEQAAEINKVRVMEREIRMMKTKIKKLEEDCTYWEKKHYDTHHELAKLKEDSETLSSKYQELNSLRKGDQILKDNLLSQIQEFKTKFVDINNKYRELVNSN